MAELLHEIEWSEPLFPNVKIPEWEKEVKAVYGSVPENLRMVSRIKWLREAEFKFTRYQPVALSGKLTDICTLVSSQENACRYCYGVVRAQMKLYGYSERLISNLEREMQVAELYEKERIFIQFCRNLARSTPRPPRKDREKLLKLGFSHLEISEAAFIVGSNCFTNRVSTFMASPPEYIVEKLPGTLIGRLLRPLIARRMRNWKYLEEGGLSSEEELIPGVVKALKGLPAAKLLQDTYQGAFQSDILSKEIKVLMFAVVARSLACNFCEEEIRDIAIDLGFSEEEFDTAINNLDSPRLNEQERLILAWTRETVHYQTGPIQRQVRSLKNKIDDEVLLEAIGIAALANAIVRIAVLLG